VCFDVILQREERALANARQPQVRLSLGHSMVLPEGQQHPQLEPASVSIVSHRVFSGAALRTARA